MLARVVCRALPALLLCACGSVEYTTGAGPGSNAKSTCNAITSVPDDVARAFDLDTKFYARYCSVYDFPVLGTANVSDAVMLEAGKLIEGVFAKRTELRDAIHDRYFRVVLVATSTGEELRDVPELHDISARENAAAGLGPAPEFPAATVRDSVILCRPRTQDPEATPPGDTLVHELGHAILDMGLPTVDSTFHGRLHAAYDDARHTGLWKLKVSAAADALFGPDLPTDNYLMTNADEYWAVGVSAWFGLKPIPYGYRVATAGSGEPPVLQLEVVYGRDVLRKQDPALSALLTEIFGPSPALDHKCTAWIPKTAP
jgi:hypothetical protein